MGRSRYRRCRSNHLNHVRGAQRAVKWYLLAIVLTVCKLFAPPFLSVRVTGPAAPDQVKLKDLPAVISLNEPAGSVNITCACATAKAAAATRNFENCIFDD